MGRPAKTEESLRIFVCAKAEGNRFADFLLGQAIQDKRWQIELRVTRSALTEEFT